MQNNTDVSKTRDVLMKDVDKLKDNAVKVAKDVREHASAHVEQTKQRVNESVQTFQETLSANPYTLLGVGFAVGFLFGLRFAR